MTTIHIHIHAMECMMTSSWEISEGFMEMVFEINLERWIGFVKMRGHQETLRQ